MAPNAGAAIKKIAPTQRAAGIGRMSANRTRDLPPSLKRAVASSKTSVAMFRLRVGQYSRCRLHRRHRRNLPLPE